MKGFMGILITMDYSNNKITRGILMFLTFWIMSVSLIGAGIYLN